MVIIFKNVGSYFKVGSVAHNLTDKFKYLFFFLKLNPLITFFFEVLQPTEKFYIQI